MAAGCSATSALLIGVPEARDGYTPQPQGAPGTIARATNLGRVIRRRDGDAAAPSAALRELPLLVVLAVVLLGLALGAAVQWRLGALLIGAALALAALLRLVLPVRRSGLLVVRSRRLDVAVLLGLGTALLVLASSVPEP